jgi:O-antigen biosynthesis protein WbqP
MNIKRLFDFLVAVVLAMFLLPLILVVAFGVKVTSPGSILFWSDRVGRNNKLFKMPKFRSMRVDTPLVATDELNNPRQYLTSIGSFLRTTSLDELPQIWCILKGEMSFVGPRPALYNQYQLVKLRALLGVDQLYPGLTGWAQVNGRDELSIEIKVQYDAEYLQRQSFMFDLYIVWLTAVAVFGKRGISH